MQLRKKTPLLLKVMSRLGSMEFQEEWLPRGKDGTDTYALWQPNGTITVNVIPHVVDSVIHECLHELYPEYSEQAIRSLTGKLRRMLTEQDEQAIYDEYRHKVDT